MSHSILAADTRSHVKALATAIVLAVSLVVIAGHLYGRPSALRDEAQAQWACLAPRSAEANLCRSLGGRHQTHMSLAAYPR
jgi:hypothetical protein